MNRRTLLGPTACLLLLAAPAAAQHFPSSDSLAVLARNQLGRTGIGLVLGVLEADGTTRIVSAGSAGLDARPLGPKSVFEVGSITKAFTGVLLADLAERGLLKLDDPVAKHLPAGTTVPSRNGREITLLDLATHRSSLTRMPTNMTPDGANPYPRYTIPELYAYLAEHRLRRDIGSEYEYSNIAVALLGHVLERVSGKPYEELLQERILRPLGMSMTATSVQGPMREWLAVGHGENGLAAPYRGWPDLPGMGAIRSNAEDMLKFVAANARPPATPLGRALRASHARRNAISPAADIGLNWMRLKAGDVQVVGHGGNTQGFSAFIAFDSARGIGAVALANHAAAPITNLVLSLINPRVPLAAAAVERTQVDVPEAVLRRHVGDYELRPDFSLDVSLENGTLHVQPTGQPRSQLFPESETKFFLRTVNAQLTFTRDSAGRTTGLVLHQGGRDQPARRRIAPGVPLAAADTSALPGRKATLASRLLGGDRAIRVVVPAGYELSQSSRYPVLLVVDGAPSLHGAAGVAGNLAARRSAPEMIVAHVAQPLPAQRAAFARFVDEELRPWLDREYRTASFGILVAEPPLLAASRAFAAEVAAGGGTAPRASFGGRQQPAPTASDAHAALRESLLWLFDGWSLPNLATALADSGGRGIAAVERHYATLSSRYGYTVVPPEPLVDETALGIGRNGRYDDAIRLLERNRAWHPGSAVAWNHLGDVFRLLCRWPEAQRHYDKALELARAMQYANVSNYAMEQGRMAQEIASGRACTPPGATRPAVTLPETVLRGYAGEYVLSPRISIVVAFENGALTARPTGEPARPIRALSETRFFVEGSQVEMTFVKDASGAVTGMTVHQGGRDVEARKVR